MTAYRGSYEGVYTLYPDKAIAVNIASTDHTFTDAVTVYVGGAGNVVVTPFGGGSNVTFTMPAGSVVPIRVSAVIKTNTTATSMIAVY